MGRSTRGGKGDNILTLTIRALVTACGVRSSVGVAIFAAAVVAAIATLCLCSHAEESLRNERRGGAGHADDDDVCAVGKRLHVDGLGFTEGMTLTASASLGKPCCRI